MQKQLVWLLLIAWTSAMLLGCDGQKDAEAPDANAGAFIDRNGNGVLDVYEDETQPRSERVADLISRLTLEQKIALVSGTGFAMGPEDSQGEKVPGAAGFTAPIEDLGIPSIVLADGPAGVRIWPNREGADQTFYATAFPIETALSSSWDLALLEEVGRAFGHELKEYGIDVLLAPGINIHRDPRGGRNFEYYSEDPLLNGQMAAAMVRGVQSEGVGATPKHYVANNQETNRYNVDTVVSERTLREIYLRGFQIAVQESNPWAIMSAYNRVNGVPASQDKALIETVLRDEWGFEGVVMTDWFAGMDDTVAQMNAGNELLMPGMPEGAAQLRAGLESGALSEARLDRNVGIILDVVMRSLAWQGYAYSDRPDLEGNAQIARRAAAQGTVLLKNDNGALPLGEGVKRAAVFGNQSYEFISGGAGSGDVNEAYTVSLVEGLESVGISVDAGLRGDYEGYLKAYKESLPEKERFWELVPPAPERVFDDAAIASQSQSADVALITIGRNSGEFQDRPVEGDFYLVEDELRLVERVSQAFHEQGKPVVVILNIGNVVETASWRDLPDAIVVPWQGGQEAGNAVADVLTGKVNPSGKLPTTFPMSYEETPTHDNFPGQRLSAETVTVMDLFDMWESQVDYEEGVYIGYRYYDSAEKDVAYPFGFGLSYSEFSYSDTVGELQDEALTLSVRVTNSGSVAGREVVQLYVSAPEAGLHKPTKELRGFAKTAELAPGASEVITFTLDVQDLASFDPARRAWVSAAGEYRALVGASSRDIRGEVSFALAEDRIVESVVADLSPKKPLEEAIY
ncbi:MAG: glycoside hydrolase family 3 N-terminal domain-containing protein [Halieaceae bacterium]